MAPRPRCASFSRLAAGAAALVFLGATARDASAAASSVYSMTDLGTDQTVKAAGKTLTVLDSAWQVVPADLRTPRTAISGGPALSGGVPGGPAVAALVNPGGVVQSLGTLGGIDSKAVGLNAAGQVVGLSSLADGSQHVFLYDAGKMIDLNAAIPPNTGYNLERPFGIADDGRIAVLASRNGVEHALLLTPMADPLPVPEPASWAVLLTLTAASGLVFRHHRKSKPRRAA